MNVEVAQRLASIRRARGYSQESLAHEPGLTRQAVSKWERAESSPDTDNLIALARLYGMGLDELLHVDADIEDDEAFERADRVVQRGADASSVARAACDAGLPFGEEAPPGEMSVHGGRTTPGEAPALDESAPRRPAQPSERRETATAVIESVTKNALIAVAGFAAIFAAFVVVLTVVSQVLA